MSKIFDQHDPYFNFPPDLVMHTDDDMTAFSDAATELQQSCNRAATELQQSSRDNEMTAFGDSDTLQ
jgi:hypothetical protein